MLNELVRYAYGRGLSPVPGFAPKDCRWAISLGRNGEFFGLLELGDTSLRKNPGRTFAKAPYLGQGELISRGETKSHFLIDTLAVVAGFGEPEEVTKSALKREYFIALLKRAATAVPSLAAAAAVLEDGTAMSRLRLQLSETKAKSTDKVTLCIDGAFPVEGTDWHEWWREFRTSLSPPGKDTGKMLCFLTGEPVQPAATHNKIQGLPGANPSGATLIGFNKPAFESYGLEQSANAAMSEEMAKTYQAGVNDLIRHHGARLGNVLVAHWYKSPVPVEDDPLAWLEDSPVVAEADAQVRAGKLLAAIRDGARPDLASNTYYAFSFSGNVGRVMVRDWMEGAFEDLAAAINAWFSDLAIVRTTSGGPAPLPRFVAVLDALVRQAKPGQERQYAPAPLATKLYRSAVLAEPIPFAVMAQAVARARVDFIQGSSPNSARMGLIRAYFERKSRTTKGASQMPQSIQPGLTEELPSPAYQCGRLMAVLAALQRAALGDVGADVVQRYYAAASSTPALVFGRLVRSAQFHLGKVRQERPGLAWWYEERIADICNRIGTAMPATLTLEQQGLFALGYYQQLATRAAKEIETKEGEK